MTELDIFRIEFGEQKIFYLVAKDTAPDLQIRFEGLNLTSYSNLEMFIRYASGDRLTKTITPDGVDLELGTVSWSAGDLIIGDHEAEFNLDSSTLPKQFPVTLKIRKDLG